MIDARQVPLALYVHLPWCVRKCPYCDFNSHAVPAGGIAEQAYVAALQRDIEHAAAGAAGRELVSVFFGGGTPSLFSPAAIARVLEHARGLLPFAADIEVTLEANPGTIEHGRFSEYAAAGVNRVSVGAQSFDDERLATLGRIHGANDTARAVDELRAAGIDNFNLDLMYALPGQDLGGALADVELAIALGPAHLSHYQLTLEPDTPFAKRPPPQLPDDELAWTMQVECQAQLAAAGFEQYEVSGYARHGRRCRHNLVYWEYGDYLGVGAGAHGKVTQVGTGAIERTVRVRHPSAYLAAASSAERLAEVRTVAASELPFEFTLNALRLVEGFTDRQFEERTGLSIAVLQAPIERAEARGLLARRGDRWQPSARGRQFLNDLQGLFLPV
jgi:putative oxygen-independent coproporphyrinogen III oxidase